jgi:MYXO-CTERM domain-containing protein
MRVIAVVGALVCALALTAPTLASAGGWASVGFEPLPDGTDAGGTWKPTIFVKQHGITPLDGLQPVVMIEETGSGEATKFLATAGSEPGEYRADVVFPSAGDWRVTILAGFGDSKVTYGPVAIGGSVTGGGDSEPLSVLGFGALAVLGLFGVVALRRSRRLTPASG